MSLSRSWKGTAWRHFQPQVLNAHNARMELRSGGCSRQDLPMKRPPNFIDAQSATTLGATIPSPPHTILSTISYDNILIAGRSGVLAMLVEVVSHPSIISNDTFILIVRLKTSCTISEGIGTRQPLWLKGCLQTTWLTEIRLQNIRMDFFSP